MLKRKKFHSVEDKGTFKDSYKKLFEYFEGTFPAWVKAPPTGILDAFFESDLEEIAKDRYLDRKTTIIVVGKGKNKQQVPEYYYRLAPRGFSELAEIRSKHRNKIALGVSIIALIISIIGLVF